MLDSTSALLPNQTFLNRTPFVLNKLELDQAVVRIERLPDIVQGASGWTIVGVGVVAAVPGNVKHAFRNTSSLPASIDFEAAQTV